MINAKLTKSIAQHSTEEKLFKLLESIDWKLWEMMNMMKESAPEKTESTSLTAAKKTTRKTTE